MRYNSILDMQEFSVCTVESALSNHHTGSLAGTNTTRWGGGGGAEFYGCRKQNWYIIIHRNTEFQALV